MKVAVVTPFYRVPAAYLERCVVSVAEQTHPCEHIVVCDGSPDDALAPLARGRDVSVIRMPVRHDDGGDTPRLCGTISALRRGFDAVCWLDADNWFDPSHVASLVALHRETGAPVCTSDRFLCDLDGRVLGPCYETHPARFIDTSCYLLTPGARPALHVFYTMADDLHPVCDRMFFAELQRLQIPQSHSGLRTAYFRTTYIQHYRHFGLRPPPDAKTGRF